ncbi:MAG: CPBP family intramembrane glutamic endopeptidase [Rhodospirillaceae bacterium]
MADYLSRVVVIGAALAAGVLALPGPRREWSWLKVVLAAPVFLALLLALSGVQQVLPAPWPWLRQNLYPYIESIDFWLFDLTVGLALVAVAEEIAFRRVFLGVWQANGWRWMTLASCGAFGLLHAPQGLYAVVGTAMAGWLLMIAYRTSGTLWVPIALHYVTNLLVFSGAFEGPA